jgi:hypothetical protein
MRKLVLALMAAGGIASFNAPAAMAMPTSGNPFAGVLDKPTQVRLYCYNTYSGEFLHWGPCGPRYYWRRPGRVYCYNRYSGRFLHWGSCW